MRQSSLQECLSSMVRVLRQESLNLLIGISSSLLRLRGELRGRGLNSVSLELDRYMLQYQGKVISYLVFLLSLQHRISTLSWGSLFISMQNLRLWVMRYRWLNLQQPRKMISLTFFSGMQLRRKQAGHQKSVSVAYLSQKQLGWHIFPHLQHTSPQSPSLCAMPHIQSQAFIFSCHMFATFSLYGLGSSIFLAKSSISSLSLPSICTSRALKNLWMRVMAAACGSYICLRVLNLSIRYSVICISGSSSVGQPIRSLMGVLRLWATSTTNCLVLSLARKALVMSTLKSFLVGLLTSMGVVGMGVVLVSIVGC